MLHQICISFLFSTVKYIHTNHKQMFLLVSDHPIATSKLDITHSPNPT